MDTRKENGFDTESDSSLSFPDQFPYEFASFGSPSSASDVGSVEAESSDDDDFLVGLTQRLTQLLKCEDEKKGVVVDESPELRLGGIGSWSFSSNGSTNSELSPPMTPFAARNESWEATYQASGQAARLKMNNEAPMKNYYQGGMFLMGHPTRKLQTTRFFPSKNSAGNVLHFNQLQNQVMQNQMLMHPQAQAQAQARHGHQMQSRERCVYPLGLPQSAWPPLVSSYQPQNQNFQHQNQNLNAKVECTGTGVFLPRPYTRSSNWCNKTGSGKVVQAAKSHLEDMDVPNNDVAAMARGKLN